MTRVLILAGSGDPQARRVVRELRALGVEARRCDASAFPERTLLAFRDGALGLGRKPLPPLRSAYLRGLAFHPLTPGFEHDLATRPRGLIAQCDEKRALLESVLLVLQRQGVRLVNSLEANAQHSQKPYQLALLRAAGLPVPAWVATNDARAVRRFAREQGRVIYKPLAGGATVRELTVDDLTDERLDSLRLAPVLFQTYVPGVPVRAYVVGAKVVAAAAIHSTELDYRRGEDRVETTRLTKAERDAVIEAARACEMPFSGVDFIRNPGGPAVLECNPSPMFAVFERKTGLDVAGPLARLLAKRP